MLTYKCPYCGDRNRIRGEAVGTTRRCAKCRREVDVPPAKDQRALDRAMEEEWRAWEDWRRYKGVRRTATLLFVLIIGVSLVFVCCGIPLLVNLFGLSP